jgi:hypothetical protein
MSKKLREVEELPSEAVAGVLDLDDEAYVQMDLLDAGEAEAEPEGDAPPADEESEAG